MIDKERVISLIAALQDYLSELEQKTGTTIKEYLSDRDKQRITERLLQLISEVELDIAEELYKGLELKLSSEEDSMLEALSQTLSKDTLSKLSIRRNLRNQLVHAYESYKKEEAFRQAKDLSDVRTFISAVKKVLK